VSESCFPPSLFPPLVLSRFSCCCSPRLRGGGGKRDCFSSEGKRGSVAAFPSSATRRLLLPPRQRRKQQQKNTEKLADRWEGWEADSELHTSKACSSSRAEKISTSFKQQKRDSSYRRVPRLFPSLPPSYFVSWPGVFFSPAVRSPFLCRLTFFSPFPRLLFGKQKGNRDNSKRSLKH
jgi:hypothetical protein